MIQKKIPNYGRQWLMPSVIERLSGTHARIEELVVRELYDTLHEETQRLFRLGGAFFKGSELQRD